MPDIELCCECGKPTGRAGKGEDSIYIGDAGPFGPDCHCADAYRKGLMDALEGLFGSGEVNNWECGCGHWNGPNLAQCAQCLRRPGE